MFATFATLFSHPSAPLVFIWTGAQDHQTSFMAQNLFTKIVLWLKNWLVANKLFSKIVVWFKNLSQKFSYSSIKIGSKQIFLTIFWLKNYKKELGPSNSNISKGCSFKLSPSTDQIQQKNTFLFFWPWYFCRCWWGKYWRQSKFSNPIWCTGSGCHPNQTSQSSPPTRYLFILQIFGPNIWTS